jgi:response regulator RpfG family c-di-GMP phosphodiesterase
MKKKVLIIDDAEEMVALMRRVLEMKELEVYSAMDGKSGVHLARELLPDLITLDFNMPDQNGVEVYSQLRSVPATAVIPVIFISCVMTGLIRRMIVESPYIAFMQKPVRREELERCAEAMLNMPKLPPPPPLPLKKKSGFEQYE